MNAAPATAPTAADNAATVADCLFPGDYSGSVLDSDGRSWRHTKEELTAAVRRIPPVILAAHARAVEDHVTGSGTGFDPDLLHAIGSRALRFIDITLRNRREGRRAIGSPGWELSALGNALVFADILQAFADAHRLALGTDDGPWDSWPDALDALRDLLGARAAAAADAGSPLRLPELGYIAADEEEVMEARVNLLTDLPRRFLLTRAADEQTRAVLRRHHSDPARVLAVIAERYTLDGGVLGAVLDAEAPAVAEGAL